MASAELRQRVGSESLYSAFCTTWWCDRPKDSPQARTCTQSAETFHATFLTTRLWCIPVRLSSSPFWSPGNGFQCRRRSMLPRKEWSSRAWCLWKVPNRHPTACWARQSSSELGSLRFLCWGYRSNCCGLWLRECFGRWFCIACWLSGFESRQRLQTGPGCYALEPSQVSSFAGWIHRRPAWTRLAVVWRLKSVSLVCLCAPALRKLVKQAI